MSEYAVALTGTLTGVPEGTGGGGGGGFITLNTEDMDYGNDVKVIAGQLNAHGKVLRNLGKSIQSDAAATVGLVAEIGTNHLIKKFLSDDKKFVDVDKHVLFNVGESSSDDDAATVGFVRKTTLAMVERERDRQKIPTYPVGGAIISELGDPTEQGDAVNLKKLYEVAICQSRDLQRNEDIFAIPNDAKRLTNLADGVRDSDAVTLKQFKTGAREDLAIAASDITVPIVINRYGRRQARGICTFYGTDEQTFRVPIAGRLQSAKVYPHGTVIVNGHAHVDGQYPEIDELTPFKVISQGGRLEAPIFIELVIHHTAFGSYKPPEGLDEGAFHTVHTDIITDGDEVETFAPDERQVA